MNDAALILVDVQKDFLPGGPLAAKDGREVIPVINRLGRHFDRVLATQDWHPPDHQSFADNHAGHDAGETIDLNGLEQILWPVHCVQRTEGAQFADNLRLDEVEKVFQKGIDPEIDSYSGFFDNGHRRSTGLNEYLKEKEITTVYIAGLTTEYCVKYTALDAVELGYDTHVIVDACRPVEAEPGDGEKAVAEMKKKGVKIETAEEVRS